jgi:PAS domain S-box-containing protein
MGRSPDSEYQDLKDRLKEFFSKLSQYKKTLEDMREWAMKLDQQHMTHAFFENIFILEFSQYTSLLTLLKDLEAKLDTYEEGKIRPEGEESEMNVRLRLNESEEKLRSIFDSSPNAITVTDLEGKITDCNQATLDLHGYASKKELIGKSAFDLIARRDHEKALMNLKRTLEEGAVKGVEYTFMKRDGREFPAELSAGVVRDVQDKPESFMAITMDISARKRAEKGRRDSEERLKILFEEAPDALFLIDLHGEFIDCNKAAERLTGYTKEEIIGKSFAELRLLPEEQIPVAFEGMAEAIEHKITGLDRYNLRRKDRTEAVVEIKAQAVNIKDKTFMLGIVRDVTARSLAEQELAIKDQVVGSSVLGVAISDPAGALAYVNDAFLKMWGYGDAQEVLGKSAVDFWKEKKKASKAIAALQQEGRWEGKLVARKKDGSAIEVHISARLAKDKEGDPIGMTGTFIDQGVWKILAASSTANFS